MKTINFIKTLIICFLLLETLQINAQQNFAIYNNTFIGKTYNIQISLKGKDEYSLYIDAMPLDKLHKIGGITINQKQMEDFVLALKDARLKYEEWVKIAKENNVKELDKVMALKSTSGSFFQFGDKWNFQFLVNLKFNFKILNQEDGIKYLLIVNTGELKSSSNEFIEVDGFVLVFSSTKEIDEFSSAISLEKIQEFINKPKKEELFKD
jgi:hypothetical protein